jgi:hypothetical protein
MLPRINLDLLRSFCLAIVLLVGYSHTSSAQVVVSLDAAGNTNVDLGAAGSGKTIDFYLSSLADTDKLFGISAQFTLAGGVIPGAVGVESSSNDSGTVSATGLGTPGYFGAGNLSTSSINKGSDTFFVVNQEFTNAAQPLPTEPTRDRWITLNLDTTGLAPNTYGISLQDVFIDETGAAFIPRVPNNDLSFTVSAITVPEPSSLLVLTAIGAMGCLRRRRHNFR